jgi:hypothetical protein
VNQAGLNFSLSKIMPASQATGLFPALCTIQTPDGTFTASRAPSNNWISVSGMIGIPCQDEPPSVTRVQATEVKDLAEIMAKGLRHVLLNGSFPALVALKFNGQVRAVITDKQGNAVTYEILGAESDSQSMQTRFECQKVTL